jgi:hypothetical protein
MKKIQLFYIVIWIFIIYILYYSIEDFASIDTNYDISNDGICILYDKDYCLSNKLPTAKFKHDILEKLPPGYEFLDYSYIIKNTSLSYFHRDVTSSQHIYNSKYPVYTCIIYKYDGDFLSLCPGSHSTYPFVTSRIVNISGKPGTAFLFDCNILHSGCKNSCKKREIVQYKVCHKDDIYLFPHLINKHVEKNELCSMSFYESCVKKMSYYFEFPINYILYPLMIDRKDDNNFIGKIQSYIPLTFYNNV